MSRVAILASAFVISVVALLAFIAVQRSSLPDDSPAAARVIFGYEEIGHIEEPASAPAAARALQGVVDRLGGRDAGPAPEAALHQRAAAHASSAPIVSFFCCCALVWLPVASAAGLTASIKLHQPDWLTGQSWLSFGRVRTLHLNAVAYGWAPMAGLGVALFVLPRLLGTPLRGARFALLGGHAVDRGAHLRTGEHRRGPQPRARVAGDSLAGRPALRDRWSAGRHAARPDAGEPECRAPLRVRLAHGLRSLLVPCPVPRCELARAAR